MKSTNESASPYRPALLLEYNVGLSIALPSRIMTHDIAGVITLALFARMPLQTYKNMACGEREYQANCERENKGQEMHRRNQWKFYGKMLLDTAAYTAGVASAYADQFVIAYGPAVMKCLEDILK